jgi:hypothetical protein
MAWEVVLRCDRCSRKYRLRTGDFRYYAVAWQPADLPVWERVTCSDQDGWCHRCRRPRAIELVPPLEALELYRMSLLGKGEAERLARAEADVRWRQERSSPPRCLSCGSAAVEPLGEDFRHPGCGGRFEVAETPWHLNTSVAFVVPAEGPPERGWLWVWWSRLAIRYA